MRISANDPENFNYYGHKKSSPYHLYVGRSGRLVSSVAGAGELCSAWM